MASKDSGKWVVPGTHFVTFEDGPRAGTWETEQHWREALDLAVFNGESEEVGRTLGYHLTSTVVEHPRWPEAKARVWRWTQ